MIESLQQFVARGGPAVIVIMLLSVALYTRCFGVLLGLRPARFRVVGGSPAARLAWLDDQQAGLREDFRQQRVALGSMIAAAPLLGLLGTVGGMVKTFESLSSRTSGDSMAGLAGGISEVLVATESGLAVALPAMLLLYVAHRQMTKRLAELGRQAEAIRQGEGA